MSVACLVASLAAPVKAQSSPAQTISAEIVAFNAHDAKAVANFHAPTAKLMLFKTGKVLAQGRPAMTAFFAKSFQQNPHEHATMTEQIVMKGIVVRHYTVTGGGALANLITVYDVENNLISNEWLILP